MDKLMQEPYKDTDKLADDALEELNSLGLGYGAHTVIGMAIGKLKAFESTGLTPEQVVELEEDYAVKGTLLAEYQATGLTPEQIKAQMENLKTAYSIIDDYEKKISEGLLVRLPCKARDKVYIVDETEKEIEEGWVCEINIDDDGIAIMIADNAGTANSSGHTVDEFGETIFLSLESAEEALEEMEDVNG